MAEAIRRAFTLDDLSLPEAFRPAHLAVALIDAVFASGRKPGETPGPGAARYRWRFGLVCTLVRLGVERLFDVAARRHPDIKAARSGEPWARVVGLVRTAAYELVLALCYVDHTIWRTAMTADGACGEAR